MEDQGPLPFALIDKSFLVLFFKKELLFLFFAFSVCPLALRWKF
jgi:hypothetical protein